MTQRSTDGHMIVAYDPSTAARLLEEAREDDGRMLSVFHKFGDSHLVSAAGGLRYGTHAVVSALKNRADMADQLEAAVREIDRLRARLGADGEPEPRIALVVYLALRATSGVSARAWLDIADRLSAAGHRDEAADARRRAGDLAPTTERTIERQSDVMRALAETERKEHGK